MPGPCSANARGIHQSVNDTGRKCLEEIGTFQVVHLNRKLERLGFWRGLNFEIKKSWHIKGWGCGRVGILVENYRGNWWFELDLALCWNAKKSTECCNVGIWIWFLKSSFYTVFRDVWNELRCLRAWRRSSVDGMFGVPDSTTTKSGSLQFAVGFVGNCLLLFSKQANTWLYSLHDFFSFSLMFSRNIFQTVNCAKLRGYVFGIVCCKETALMKYTSHKLYTGCSSA